MLRCFAEPDVGGEARRLGLAILKRDAGNTGAGGTEGGAASVELIIGSPSDSADGEGTRCSRSFGCDIVGSEVCCKGSCPAPPMLGSVALAAPPRGSAALESALQYDRAAEHAAAARLFRSASAAPPKGCGSSDRLASTPHESSVPLWIVAPADAPAPVPADEGLRGWGRSGGLGAPAATTAGRATLRSAATAARETRRFGFGALRFGGAFCRAT
jgi:hypothetical protein